MIEKWLFDNLESELNRVRLEWEVKAAEKKKELQDALEEKLTIKEDEKTTPDKVEQFLDEKITDSKDNTVLLNEEDIKTIVEIARIIMWNRPM